MWLAVEAVAFGAYPDRRAVRRDAGCAARATRARESPRWAGSPSRRLSRRSEQMRSRHGGISHGTLMASDAGAGCGAAPAGSVTGAVPVGVDAGGAVGAGSGAGAGAGAGREHRSGLMQ